MFDSFTADIPAVISVTENQPDNSNYKRFRFTKNRIWFTKKHVHKVYYLHFYEGCPITNGIKYTLEKVYDENDKLRWEIKFTEDKHGCKCYIALSWHSAFICNIMHDRYWLFNEKRWLLTFLIGFVALIISLLNLIKPKG